jgi:hypothetical protein
MQPIDTDKALKIAERFLPHIDQSEVVIQAPGEGPGFWVGASSAIEVDGVIYMAYRTRQPIELGRGQGVTVAKSEDGVRFETICTISKESMDAESLERPTLIRTPEGKWHLYLSCATTGTKHWRVELLAADDPSLFTADNRKVVLPGDDKWAVKDTIITIQGGVWHLWATLHPLERKDHEDRMVSRYATSSDGISWRWQDGMCLTPCPSTWFERGARLTAVHFAGEDGLVVALFDGRATAEENYDERTGVAVGTSPDALIAIGSQEKPFAESADGKALRYADIVPLTTGQYRLYYELARQDGSHELRTELV